VVFSLKNGESLIQDIKDVYKETDKKTERQKNKNIDKKNRKSKKTIKSARIVEEKYNIVKNRTKIAHLKKQIIEKKDVLTY
jgi:hypothetical protein